MRAPTRVLAPPGAGLRRVAEFLTGSLLAVDEGMSFAARTAVVSVLCASIACSAGKSEGAAPAPADGAPAEDGSMAVDAPADETGSADGFRLPDDAAATSDGDVCAGEIVTGEPTPLDMMIMLDQSSSMKGQRWLDVTSALKSFVGAPAMSGVNVALNYFALSRPCPLGNECTSFFGSGASGCSPLHFCKYDDYCSAAAYEKPEVPFSALPGAASLIVASLDAHGPYYDTTSLPALQGSIHVAQARAKASPGHKVVVVFATDGLPESHCEDGFTTSDKVADVAAVAKIGVTGTPSIPTYVVGVGSSLSALNQVAAAGGTTSAYLVDGSTNAKADFLKAMEAIRGSALPCEYVIPKPSSGSPDFAKVNVLYTPAGGVTGAIKQVAGASACGAAGGWYYDDPTSPTRIEICPATCGTFRGTTGGTVSIQLGCRTVIS